jgi:tRNA(fMet)-specific endonuclease VapC
MSLYILDTDTLTLFQHGHAMVTSRCAARPPGESAITVISVEEQLDGRFTAIRRARRPDDLAIAY